MADLLLKVWAVMTVIGASIPFVREQTWWLRAWTYARIQMLFVCALTAFAYLFFIGSESVWDKLVLGLLAFACLGCLYDIVPFTKLWSKQCKDLANGDTYVPIRMMVGNVLMDNQNHEAFLSQVSRINPDIVFLVETNETWKAQLSHLEAIYPFRYLLPLPDYNGMLFYSRFPILNVQERYLVQDYIPSLTIDLDVGHSEPLRFYGLHPRPPRPEDDTADLDKELSFIANEAGHVLGPIIVTGDLNDVGWSSTTKKFLRMSGLLDPRIGRGFFNSYNAKNPLVRWPLDHVFLSKHFSLIDMQRLEPCGSDHFPLLISLALHYPAAETSTLQANAPASRPEQGA